MLYIYVQTGPGGCLNFMTNVIILGGLPAERPAPPQAQPARARAARRGGSGGAAGCRLARADARIGSAGRHRNNKAESKKSEKGVRCDYTRAVSGRDPAVLRMYMSHETIMTFTIFGPGAPGTWLTPQPARSNLPARCVPASREAVEKSERRDPRKSRIPHSCTSVHT